MIHFKISSNKIRNRIFIPKYYNPGLTQEIDSLKSDYNLLKISELVSSGAIKVETGDEIGKMAYGTGNIPFVRTSDISNWEIKSSPKQGVSQEIFEQYNVKQDVKNGDILIVRDGTYLIGTNCFITELDETILYQSHILKIRIIDKKAIDPILFFVALNSVLVKRQIRAIQFTADIIDTIGSRFSDVIIPILKNESKRNKISKAVLTQLKNRVIGKAFIKQCPSIIENILVSESTKEIEDFSNSKIAELKDTLVQDTIRAEFGEFESFWKSSNQINNRIYLPKYYAPSIESELKALSRTCDIISIKELKEKKQIDFYTGDEIGKMAYGTGSIPFIRTSDFSNWEIKHDPKQGISQEIYDSYNSKQQVKEGDIFLVRDGTYLVGTSCLVTKEDHKCLFCGGLYKISIKDSEYLNSYLLLGLLNSYIVKRQIRTKQFTRDVIDTLGNRINEIFLPIPKKEEVRKIITDSIKRTVDSRIKGRNMITEVVNNYAISTKN